VSERIESIKEVFRGEGWSTEAGFEVVTDAQKITLLMDDDQSCCERFGYFWCNDDPQEFVGAELLGISITDDALSEAHMKKNELDPSCDYFEGGVMFVNLETDRGTLQFVAYNEHNGYYGHGARVESKQLTHNEVL
jgi:hypothetical protein